MKSTPRFLLVLLATGLFCACAAPSKRAELARAAQGEANSALLNRVEMPQSQDPQAKSRPKDVTVRILLAENQKSARIKHSGKIYIYTLDLAKKYKISSSGMRLASARACAAVKCKKDGTFSLVIFFPLSFPGLGGKRRTHKINI